MAKPMITVSGVGKRYDITAFQGDRDRSIVEAAGDIYRELSRNIRSLVSPGSYKEDDDHIWALRDITFSVGRGETLGIIGHNGAGKSTMLKILTRITDPTEGEIRLGGRVAALLEVGTGFNGLLSGRENIYLNGSILGMTTAEIDAQFDEIVEFAGISKFIDTPVRHYSSGMNLRLGFAVAAHLQPDIMLIDEILAVGDAEFQRKCLGKMNEVADEGRTVIFVSHDLAAIQNLCDRCILLENGNVVADDETNTVISHYLSTFAEKSAGNLRDIRAREGNGDVLAANIRMINSDDEVTDVFSSGESVAFEIDYEIINQTSTQRMMKINLGIRDMFGKSIILLSNEFTGEVTTDWSTQGTLRCELPELPLIDGNYTMNIFITMNGGIADWLKGKVQFQVAKSDYYGTGSFPTPSQAAINLKHSWMLK